MYLVILTWKTRNNINTVILYDHGVNIVKNMIKVSILWKTQKELLIYAQNQSRFLHKHPKFLAINNVCFLH